MTSYRRTTSNAKLFIDMDTERVYMKNSESNHFQMEYQKPTTQVASYEFATDEWNNYASYRDVSMEDAWMESYRSEVNTLLKALEETQSMIKGCVDEIIAQRWTRDMEKRMEWERKRADDLDEYERWLEIAHQNDMEKLRQEHDRLLQLKECKRESKMEGRLYRANVEDAIEEITNVEDTSMMEEIIKSKHRKDGSIGCFGFARKLFKRRSKEPKRDGKSDD